jgi:undecaprenyl-diphosphatase
MDTSLFFFINKGLQNIIFDAVMPFITQNAHLFFAVFVFCSLFLGWRKALIVFSLCVIALIVSDGSGHILKDLLERPRPCQILENVRLLVGCGGSYSLPSNHAVNAFALAAVFGFFFRRIYLLVFFIASLVAFSRIYVGVHYPSDVIAGAVLGVITAGAVLASYTWSSGRFREKPYSTAFILTLLALTFFRYYYLVTGPLDVSPDEAHYWEWSRRLDFSYYSKGPVIAYLIAFTTWLMGDTIFGIRFFSPLLLALSSVVIYLFTRELFPDDKDDKRPCIAGLLLQITPLFAPFGVLMTIDSPFIFFWSVSLYLFWKAINSNASSVMRNGLTVNTHNASLISHHGFSYWLLLGLTVGLGLLTKYTMAFFYLCASFIFLFFRDQRHWLKRKGPYVALAASVIVFSPVIIWNSAHDWVTVKHTAGQAHIAEGFKISFKHFVEFLGSQIGVLTPLLFFIVMYGAIKQYVAKYTSPISLNSSRFLFWFWAPVLGFFLLKSLQAKVQANWAMPAYITAFIAATDFFFSREIFTRGIKILIAAAFIIALSVTLVAHYPAILDLPVKMDPSSRLRGWKELGIKAGKLYNSMKSRGSRNVFLFSDKYQVSGELAFYTSGKPKTYCVNLGRRMNQYDIWGGFDKLIGYDAIFVTIDNVNFPNELKASFDSFEKEIFEVREKDKILRKYSLFTCYDFKGFRGRRFESY